MKFPFVSSLREWLDVIRFGLLRPELKAIVFYSEGPESAPHLAPILEDLLENRNQHVCYATSNDSDPILRWSHDQLTTFRVGAGSARSALFSGLRAGVMVMTTPDLETMELKRSNHHVHYVYVHHAINSMHMAYRLAAFDHFDAILCVGPHHREEIREMEKIYGLNQKVLVDHGYGRLDSIINRAVSTQTPSTVTRVLIAPTWGDHALLETCGEAIVELLLDAGFQITVRPHPMTLRHRSRLLNALEQRFENNSNFRLDRDTSSEQSLYDSDIMIGDWGGMALEYAFGLERPVISVDLQRKVNNPDYERLSIEPLEVKLRPLLGAVVQPDAIESIPGLINELCANPETSASRARELRSRYIYNIGESGSVGSNYLMNVVTREDDESER